MKKNVQRGLICLLLGAIALPSMAAPKSERGDRYEQRRGDRHERKRDYERPSVAVAEPGSLVLLSAGVAGIVLIRRFKK